MKTSRKILVGTILVGLAGFAHAIPTTLTDPIVLYPSAPIGGTSVQLSYNLTAYGYDSTLHSLDSAFLSLVFTVSGQNQNQINNANASQITVSLAGQTSFTSTVGSFGTASPPVIEITSAALNFAEGLLNFSLTRGPNPGTVTLSQATLSVNASLRQAQEQPPETGAPANPGAGGPVNQIPEPGTLALLSLGLLGGVLIRRRKV